MTKPKTRKISKGYRLKPETHRMISRIQQATKTDLDTVIFSACKMYYNHLRKTGIKNKIYQ